MEDELWKILECCTNGKQEALSEQEAGGSGTDSYQIRAGQVTGMAGQRPWGQS